MEGISPLLMSIVFGGMAVGSLVLLLNRPSKTPATPQVEVATDE
jgi:hypothetical protein